MPGKNQTLKGTVERLRFRDEQSFYTVAELSTAQGRVVVVGEFYDIQEDAEYRVEGEWVTHPRYGQQFKVRGYQQILPTSESGIVAYLSSGLIKGIGPKTARRIVEKFGEETLSVITESPDRLLEVEGIAGKRQDQIIESLAEHRHVQDTVTFLGAHGIGLGLSLKIYREYGSRSVEVVKHDPYRLTDEVFGIGFRTADRLALKLGLHPHSPQRIRAALKYVLGRAADSMGHCYLPEDQLLEAVSKLLSTGEDGDPSREEIMGALVLAQSRDEITADGEDYYPSWLYQAETRLAERLRHLAYAARQSSHPLSSLEPMVERIEGAVGLEYAPLQRKALLETFSSGMTVLTGGPGTGKTTVVEGILHMARLLKPDVEILLAAPTGRAARRMTELTGVEACTIHRLLGYQVINGVPRFQRGGDEPLEGDILIVDETSMLDVSLAARLFEAVPTGMRVLLVGDADQLPPVGPGYFLRDLIASGLLPVVELNQIYRQEEASDIVLNAHRINAGKMPVFTPGGDAEWVERAEPEEVGRCMRDRVRNLVFRLGMDREEVQVLSPMRRGEVGVEHLNQSLQQSLNPPSGNKPEIRRGQVTFRLGDKVMCIRNNYDKGAAGIFNGNIGTVRGVEYLDNHAAVTEDTLVIDFDGEEVLYGRSELDELELAYAITVHKSQGSEFRAVIMPMSTQHYMMLQRNLLYTAVTRAREQLIMVGTKKAMAMAVKNDRQKLRHTKLVSRLRD